MAIILRQNPLPMRDLLEFIRAQVEQLETDPRLGLSPGSKFVVGETLSGCLVETGEYWADRFKLRLPYAGSHIRCEIMFNAKFPYMPPDFIFPDAPGFEPNLDNLPSLSVKWDIERPESLSSVISELLVEFKQFQVDRLRGSRLQFYYDSLLTALSYKAEDLQVYLTPPNGNVMGSINFLIKLDIDYAQLPVYLTEDNLVERNCLLLVRFQSPEGNRGIPQLFLSPDIQRIFDLVVVGGVHVLPYTQETSLIDYVPDVKKQLESLIGNICEAYDRRRNYINAFLFIYKQYVLEYDVASYSKISFLFNYRDFHFILLIELTMKFPTDQPMFTFQSIYHVGHNGQPYKKREGAYPYSPRWTCAEMAERAKTYVLENIGAFQKESVGNGQKWDIRVE